MSEYRNGCEPLSTWNSSGPYYLLIPIAKGKDISEASIAFISEYMVTMRMELAEIY